MLQVKKGRWKANAFVKNKLNLTKIMPMFCLLVFISFSPAMQAGRKRNVTYDAVLFPGLSALRK